MAAAPAADHWSTAAAAISVWNGGLSVRRGSTTVLTSDMLSAEEIGVDRSSARLLVYRVTTPPRLGYLGLRHNTSSVVRKPVSQFTHADLDARRVVYVAPQSVSDVTDTDSFRFRLTDAGKAGGAAVSLAEGEFYVTVKGAGAVGVETTGASTTAAVAPSLDVNVPVTVIEGYRTPLTAANLHAVVSTGSGDVWYRLVEPPRHGQLLRAGVAVTDGGRFRQSDLDAGRMEYRSDGSDTSMMDYFLFTLQYPSAAVTDDSGE